MTSTNPIIFKLEILFKHTNILITSVNMPKTNINLNSIHKMKIYPNKHKIWGPLSLAAYTRRITHSEVYFDCIVLNENLMKPDPVIISLSLNYNQYKMNLNI